MIDKYTRICAIRQSILDYGNQCGQSIPHLEIAKALNISLDMAYRTLRAMERDGEVVCHKHGRTDLRWEMSATTTTDPSYLREKSFRRSKLEPPKKIESKGPWHIVHYCDEHRPSKLGRQDAQGSGGTKFGIQSSFGLTW